MYKKIALVALIMIIVVSPVYALGTNVNSSLATLGNNVIQGDTITIETPTEICGYYGYPISPGKDNNMYNARNPTYPTVDTGFTWDYDATWVVSPGTTTVPIIGTYQVYAQTAMCTGPDGGSLFAKIEHLAYNSTAYAPVNVTFRITNSTSPLSGVLVEIPGQSMKLTDSNGNATIPLYPHADTYSYFATKLGYADKIGSVGTVGITGGTIYITMVPGISGTSTATTIHAIDANSGNHIVGAEIDGICVANYTWTNRSTSDGTSVIVCPDGDILDVYLSMGGVYSPVYSLGIPQGGDYYLGMYPITTAAPIGYANLFVSVKDGADNSYLQYAAVTSTLPTGEVTGDSTGSSGTTKFVVPNNTVIIIGASKSGYTSMSKSISSGIGANVATTITLQRATQPTVTVTPTMTDADGNIITPVPTYLPYCDPHGADYDEDMCAQSQDSAMMSKLRDAGPQILDLAIYAILLSLLAAIFMALKSITKW